MLLLILVLWGLGAAGIYIMFEAVPGPVWPVIHKYGKPEGLILFLVLALWPFMVVYALFLWVMVYE
jgi:hypothetical protein